MFRLLLLTTLLTIYVSLIISCLIYGQYRIVRYLKQILGTLTDMKTQDIKLTSQINELGDKLGELQRTIDDENERSAKRAADELKVSAEREKKLQDLFDALKAENDSNNNVDLQPLLDKTQALIDGEKGVNADNPTETSGNTDAGTTETPASGDNSTPETSETGGTTENEPEKQPETPETSDENANTGADTSETADISENSEIGDTVTAEKP